ncbi:fused DSP-PTPase phosphatase/NAD kinase-like protein [Endozoicomonas sp.]|uniref:phosphatase domain-containing protein n=1 Tax=Endozoicomonas sp. TaxID=1892382 RepID=UPI0028882762|nr:tyrosine-protein phosphatase [Endozoicomonas sp.]
MKYVRFRYTLMIPLFFLTLTIFSQSTLAHDNGAVGDRDHVNAADYESGSRGDLPPEADELNHQRYEILGEKDGLKAWLIRYDEHFYRGGELKSIDGARSLAKLGIKTVVAMTSADKEREWLASQGINTVDLSFTKNAELGKQQLRQIAEMMSSLPSPFYIHCVGGTQRAGILGIIYRLSQGWDPDQALLEFAYLGGSLKANDKTIKSVLQAFASAPE